MNDRGEYRTFFCAFADDPDVHTLSGDAVKLLVFLKLSLPATGIGVVYNAAQAERMQMSLDQLDQLYRELETPKPGSEHGWIRRDRNVVWVVNALKFEPGLSPANTKKHVPFVRRLVAELDPKLSIVRAFKRHYHEWFPADSEPYQKGIDTLSQGPAPDRVSHRVSIQKKRKEEKRKTSGLSGKERGPRGRAKDLVAQLPAAAREFGKHFYRSARRDRQVDVMEQLLATLNGGAAYGRGVKITAGSVARLEVKCREVIAEGVKDPDKAIVVLLKKLADVSDDSPTERAQAAQRAEVQRDQADATHRLELAEAWLTVNPDAALAIEKSIEKELGADVIPPVRAIYRNAAVLRAWTDAGEPIVQPAGGV